MPGSAPRRSTAADGYAPTVEQTAIARSGREPKAAHVVLAHVVMGSGMVMTGVVTWFPLLAVSQCLWGLGWALSSGADVAWVTDELDDADRVDRVLVAQGRQELLGTVAGLVGAGTIAWATTLEATVVGTGTAMVTLGAVVARWPERHIVRLPAGQRWTMSMTILRHGAATVRTDRVVRLVLVGTAFLNGGAVGFGRLLEQRLLGLGLPARPAIPRARVTSAARQETPVTPNRAEPRSPEGPRRAAPGSSSTRPSVPSGGESQPAPQVQPTHRATPQPEVDPGCQLPTAADQPDAEAG